MNAKTQKASFMPGEFTNEELNRAILCPTCMAAGEKSKVYGPSLLSTAMFVPPFWDEEGRYHSHDPNVRKRTYECSRGHQWTELVGGRCWCGWPEKS